MTSKEVFEYANNNQLDKLFKKFEQYFYIVDVIEDEFIEGDLLDEYELAKNHDKLQGIYGKLYPVAQALESYRESKRADIKLIEKNKLDKYRAQDATILNAYADLGIKEIDAQYRNFNSYAQVCTQLSIGCQARMKRLTIQKGLKGIDYTGEVPNI